MVADDAALHAAAAVESQGGIAACELEAEEESAVLKLKGLPYATTIEEIYAFFAGFKVASVAFVLEPDGRPSGLVRVV